MQIDFLGIQAFLAVAECGSFGLAAARLHLSQTAISHRMRKLEESLGVQLIVRTSRGITLTEAGDALLPRARSSVQELGASCDAVRTHGQSVSQWVAFGCLPTVAAGILEPLLQAHATLQVRLFDSSPIEIVELVQARAAAFGVTVLRPMPDSLQVQTVALEPFVLACPPGHPLAGLKAVDWSALEAQPLIRISLASGNSMTIDDALGPMRERLQWRYEAQRTSVALQMVRGGLGLTVVPQLAVNAADGLAVVPIVGPEVTRMLAIVTRSGEQLRPQEHSIADTAARLIRARLPQGGQG